MTYVEDYPPTGSYIRLPAVIESESYRQGYARVQGAQASDWHERKAQGWTAASA